MTASADNARFALNNRNASSFTCCRPPSVSRRSSAQASTGPNTRKLAMRPNPRSRRYQQPTAPATTRSNRRSRLQNVPRQLNGAVIDPVCGLVVGVGLSLRRSRPREAFRGKGIASRDQPRRAEAVVAPPGTNRPGLRDHDRAPSLLNPDSEQAGSRSCVGRDRTDGRRDLDRVAAARLGRSGHLMPR